MGEIRSAIDIALEKTAQIDGSVSGKILRDIKNQGVKAAAEYMESGNGGDLKKSLKNFHGGDKGAFINGALTILLTSVKLPEDETDADKTERAAQGFQILCDNKTISVLFNQLQTLFKQYLSEKTQLKQLLLQQFSVQIRQKEQELSRLYGREIRLQPEQDAEFNGALRKNLQALGARYEPIINEAREQLKTIAGYTE